MKKRKTKQPQKPLCRPYEAHHQARFSPWIDTFGARQGYPKVPVFTSRIRFYPYIDYEWIWKYSAFWKFTSFKGKKTIVLKRYHLLAAAVCSVSQSAKISLWYREQATGLKQCAKRMDRCSIPKKNALLRGCLQR